MPQLEDNFAIAAMTYQKFLLAGNKSFPLIDCHSIIINISRTKIYTCSNSITPSFSSSLPIPPFHFCSSVELYNLISLSPRQVRQPAIKFFFLIALRNRHFEIFPPATPFQWSERGEAHAVLPWHTAQISPLNYCILDSRPLCSHENLKLSSGRPVHLKLPHSTQSIDSYPFETRRMPRSIRSPIGRINPIAFLLVYKVTHLTKQFEPWPINWRFIFSIRKSAVKTVEL